MRSNPDFIEVNSRDNGKKILINKHWIVFVGKAEGPQDDYAIISVTDGKYMLRMPVKETYTAVTEELLWYEDFKLDDANLVWGLNDKGVLNPND